MNAPTYWRLFTRSGKHQIESRDLDAVAHAWVAALVAGHEATIGGRSGWVPVALIPRVNEARARALQEMAVAFAFAAFVGAAHAA